MKVTEIILAAILALSGCPAAENTILQVPIASITLEKNRAPIPPGGVAIMEGSSVILSTELFPAGVQGGVYWQSSRQGIAALSALQGPSITVTGMSGGESIIQVMARNSHNEVYVETAVTVTVTPVSFFKWNYQTDGWKDIPANSNATVNQMLVRASGPALTGDTVRGGFVMTGETCFIIGSGMTGPTNSPFSDDPVYDKAGRLDFQNGPTGNSADWSQRARISADYQVLSGTAGATLRLQVNNNAGSADNASALDNWLVAEILITPDRAGTLSGVFDASKSNLVKTGVPGATDEEKLTSVLSRSFAALSLSGGTVLIKNIKIEDDR